MIDWHDRWLLSVCLFGWRVFVFRGAAKAVLQFGSQAY